MEIITEEVLLPFPARPAVRIPVSGEETLDVKSRSMIALQTQIYLTSIWEIFTLFFFLPLTTKGTSFLFCLPASRRFLIVTKPEHTFLQNSWF